MLLNKAITLSGTILLLAAGCIETYMPRIPDDPGQYFVVSGEVTDQEGYHHVTVSIASPINDPGYIPVSGCQVEILDDIDHVFAGEEYETGKYRVYMAAEYLSAGRAYKVRIITPTGEEIISEYDRMPELLKYYEDLLF